MQTRLDGIGMTSQRTRDRLVNRLQEQGIRNISVLDAIRNTPRHLFVDEALATRAYEDTALPIGNSQTISQPYIVARMTEVLITGQQMKSVLEVGTGSGYQTAILAQLVDRVYSVERIQRFIPVAKQRIEQLQLPNVQYAHRDGFSGWPTYAPYDGIIVTAAPLEIPNALLRQLAPGGRLIIPQGDNESQQLLCITNTEDGFTTEKLDWVTFVPLVEGIE